MKKQSKKTATRTQRCSVKQRSKPDACDDSETQLGIDVEDCTDDDVAATCPPSALDWKPLMSAFREAFDWSLDVAAALARDYPEEVEAVERTREFMRARLANRPAMVSVDDVLLTFGLLIGAIERDLGPIQMLTGWLHPPLAMHLPGAPGDAPTVPRVFVTQLGTSPHRAPNSFSA